MTFTVAGIILDVIVFIVLTSVAVFVPLWRRIFSKEPKMTKSQYVFAKGTDISRFKLAMSVSRGLIGLRSFLGFPSEQFYRGCGMMETVYGLVAVFPLICLVFLPVYFNVQLTSVYNYLELRFNSKFIRRLASFTYVTRNLLILGATFYTPTIAMRAIVGIPNWVSLILLTIICIVFNIFGGLAELIYADLMQMIILGVVYIGVLTQATYESGGVEKIYHLNKDTGRLRMFHTDGDMTVRIDTLSAVLGQFFISASVFGCEQAYVQRLLSTGSRRETTLTLLIAVPITVIYFMMPWFAGMALYGVYYGCDPLKMGFTKGMDEILPFFISDRMQYLWGVTGLVLAFCVNGGLTVIVSGLNSLATVTYEDFFFGCLYFRKMPNKRQLAVIKLIGSLYAVAIMCSALVFGLIPGIIEGAMLITSITTGPLLGIFVLAMMIPAANWKGVAVGAISSHLLIIWMAIGHAYYGFKSTVLPTSVAQCSNATQFSALDGLRGLLLLGDGDSSDVPFLYRITYMYYSVIGALLTIVISTIASCILSSDDDIYESRFLHPFFYKLSLMCPGKPREYDELVQDSMMAMPMTGAETVASLI